MYLFPLPHSVKTFFTQGFNKNSLFCKTTLVEIHLQNKYLSPIDYK